MIGTTAHFPKVGARELPAALTPAASAPRGSAARGSAPGAFTLIEVLIVVVVVGLLATLVIPQFSSANQQARQNSLKDELQYLRTQITVFKAQHQEVPPGYTNGDPTAVPSAGAFTSQMTQHSDVSCNVCRPVSPAYPYGPYLKQLPVDPMNNLCTLSLVGNNQPMPAPDGATGWIYKPQTQEVMANVKGKDDSGTPYSAY
ncbi:MAG TPA: prepilin-type N-terminal cleavage/methylation domain-containing protein [Tepidisphaeraceae bacterium]|nr:prepilin-type N-terminal cleavage/methylation domain-containing protein [Tepidisphaeraceae bacterium]